MRIWLFCWRCVKKLIRVAAILWIFSNHVSYLGLLGLGSPPGQVSSQWRPDSRFVYFFLVWYLNLCLLRTYASGCFRVSSIGICSLSPALTIFGGLVASLVFTLCFPPPSWTTCLLSLGHELSIFYRIEPYQHVFTFLFNSKSSEILTFFKMFDIYKELRNSPYFPLLASWEVWFRIREMFIAIFAHR